jgi:hypothetical protein
MKTTRYAIWKPNRREPTCYVATTSANRAMTVARSMFDLPRGTRAYETSTLALRHRQIGGGL